MLVTIHIWSYNLYQPPNSSIICYTLISLIRIWWVRMFCVLLACICTSLHQLTHPPTHWPLPCWCLVRAVSAFPRGSQTETAAFCKVFQRTQPHAPWSNALRPMEQCIKAQSFASTGNLAIAVLEWTVHTPGGCIVSPACSKRFREARSQAVQVYRDWPELFAFPKLVHDCIHTMNHAYVAEHHCSYICSILAIQHLWLHNHNLIWITTFVNYNNN